MVAFTSPTLPERHVCCKPELDGDCTADSPSRTRAWRLASGVVRATIRQPAHTVHAVSVVDQRHSAPDGFAVGRFESEPVRLDSKLDGEFSVGNDARRNSPTSKLMLKLVAVNTCNGCGDRGERLGGSQSLDRTSVGVLPSDRPATATVQGSGIPRRRCFDSRRTRGGQRQGQSARLVVSWLLISIGPSSRAIPGSEVTGQGGLRK